jgi:Bacterial pre-peptidase C-terminal domain
MQGLMMRSIRYVLASLCLCISAVQSLHANPPVASYIFPAGGQRGTQVPVCVGGLFLHGECGFEMLGGGVSVPARLRPMPTLWFEGPLLPLPASQQAEDYPRDMAAVINIAPHAAPGARHWRLWTSQGATPSMRFVVGELPEIVEQEIDGDPIAVPVKLPVTINGRIFPREDVDLWTFHATKGQTVLCEVEAARLGSPLDARLEVLDARGQVLAENDDYYGADPRLRFVAPADGDYQVRIRDTQNQGGQAYVYRLTLTSGPHVDHFYPLGGRRGSNIKLEIAGQGLPEPHHTVTLPADIGDSFPHRLVIAGAKSNVLWLDVDDLPEHVGCDPAAMPIALPAVLNGRISTPGKIDRWKWSAKKGETYELDLRAGRLGSRLDGVLAIGDAAGKELARAEASGPGLLDPLLRFTAPADGTYTVDVQDRFRSRGGADFAYRLRAVQPKTPDFRLTLPTDAVTVPRKGQGKLKVAVERLAGFKEAIGLQVMGLPAGVTVAPATIPAGQNVVELTFKAGDSAPIQPSHVWIKGSAKIGRESARVASLAVPRGQKPQEDVLLMVALPTPFVIKGEYDMGFAARGSVHKRKYTIVRNGYDGSIEVSLADRQARHLQGVTGPTITVPAGANEFIYTAFLPPWMETGRTCRVCVMGSGVLKEPDGSEHRVSFSSVNQNEQLVAVVGPGKVALELPKLSFLAKPGQTISVPVRVKRGLGITGPVALELIAPPHVRGLIAAPATIASDRDEGELLIRCATPMAGPLNMPLKVRATLLHNGEPFTAEAKVDIQP